MSAHLILKQLAEADWDLKDPGSGGALPRSKTGIVNIVTAAAEARTLADPVKEGVLLIINFQTDGGDCTITVASAYNAAGATSIVLADAGDTIALLSRKYGSGYRWVQLSADGLGGDSITDAGGFTSQTTVEGALQEIYQHLLSTQVVVPINLNSFREVSSAGAVADSDGNGGVLASNTTPILGAGSTEAMEITWAASNSDIIATSITLPEDLDGTADAYVDLFVQANTTDQAPTFTVLSNFDGGAQITDTATAVTATTMQTITATIASGDVPDSANILSVQLVAAAHATSAFVLHGARFRYKGKLRQS